MQSSEVLESSDAAEEEEVPVSMVDVLEEEQELEADASAVLGGSDARNCTYDEHAYVKRQALYACGTCVTPDMSPAGICLACSLECHDGHDLYELYTKRNFRCDCGNGRFPTLRCRLFPDKAAANPGNRYGHNFRGVYCVCERPYPDPDDAVDDEMIQCVVCEDWHHGRHLGEAVVPDGGAFAEMVCGACMDCFAFLRAYASRFACADTDDSAPVDVESHDTTAAAATAEVTAEAAAEAAVEAVAEAAVGVAAAESKKNERKTIEGLREEEKPPAEADEGRDAHESDVESHDTATAVAAGEAAEESEGRKTTEGLREEEKPPGEAGDEKCWRPDLSKPDACSVEAVGDAGPDSEASATQVKFEASATQVKFEASAATAGDEGLSETAGKTEQPAVETSSTEVPAGTCRLKALTEDKVEPQSGATFWPEGWREKLCRCDSCCHLYDELDVAFLLDEADTITEYERRGKGGSNGASQYEQGMAALSSMNRIQQVEMIRGYDDMKSELTDYLKRFADTGKVVQADDIRAFFGEMQGRKRQKLASGITHFCR
ncbi:PREDICTED: putative E3 ubiquitin-protein ligase UBR7 [Priapulus caudatus]|uniref:E3 ubiquitin-protein ligase UBR7 n=1 Tax=Priapulus caudatus TaxID=37621 RepID=A0ABM1FAX6_PRICU|nr:PREDICTED: putative E3 ubiquitin-protein ligase UBR7 [Priapulus caudatus]